MDLEIKGVTYKISPEVGQLILDLNERIEGLEQDLANAELILDLFRRVKRN